MNSRRKTLRKFGGYKKRSDADIVEFMQCTYIGWAAAQESLRRFLSKTQRNLTNFSHSCAINFAPLDSSDNSLFYNKICRHRGRHRKLDIHEWLVLNILIRHLLTTMNRAMLFISKKRLQRMAWTCGLRIYSKTLYLCTIRNCENFTSFASPQRAHLMWRFKKTYPRNGSYLD